ncbi:proteasome subunit beta type-2-like [Epargyreus clarus]|uniref:proteasome subunit beta type-2-like n=1 Tax=Epargyreus clarus TaxID=520877 RepID=UPI003C2C1285
MRDVTLFLQCLLGIGCRDFTMIASDQTNMESILIMKDDEDKLYEISDKLLMGMSGDAGDRAQFSQFVSKNILLYKMKNGYELDTAAVTHFTRKNLAEAVQNKAPYIVNLLLGGFNEAEGGQLYSLDHIGSCIKVPYASHGLGGLLISGLMSSFYKPDLTESQAYDILTLCVYEIHKRLFMNLSNFCVKSVSKDGIKTLPVIGPNSVL